MKNTLVRTHPMMHILTPVTDGLCTGRGGTLARLADTLELWRTRSRERHMLVRLDGHLLRDIGISRADAEIEAAKPFWRD